MEELEKGMSPVQSGTEQEGSRCHHATQNEGQFKIYEPLISGSSHLIWSARGLTVGN